MGTRRPELERLLDGLHPALQLVEQTADLDLAQDWLSLPNLEGVVAKRVDRPYAPGRGRDWIKVKRQRTVDCVVVVWLASRQRRSWCWPCATPMATCTISRSHGRWRASSRRPSPPWSVTRAPSSPPFVRAGSTTRFRPGAAYRQALSAKFGCRTWTRGAGPASRPSSSGGDSIAHPRSVGSNNWVFERGVVAASVATSGGCWSVWTHGVRGAVGSGRLRQVRWSSVRSVRDPRSGMS